ncbi:hypothetical protein BU25DRAFT_408756 [Macroventuria anomochaeta]|uniref:Uncharacterized protein n=1 Tax=Macroventuria anomochaeta TaxID=301207 RepID=A0ACB6SAP4_9PLEO|nr:uncharacterized protein BU25DRAFT_408756 [Macroventuria anomochaeta]KAF2630172.1 hypothetical protein BU25DRAFT_408756 [Macroventuria anomochaeta]
MSTNPDSSLPIVRAMDIDSTSQQANPYSGQIIHAAIQVESIEPVAQAVGPLSADASLEASSSAAEDEAEKERADNMRMWWNEAIAKNMNLPEGYEHVAVLIVKWADELDELKTRTEALELETLFRDRFHYHTETVELNVKGKAQLQLNSRISSFAAEHNGPNNLLIIYYTGHGVYFEDKKFLQLAACANPANGKGLYQDAHANWNKAEDILKADEVDADVLTILDACYASNITKSAVQTNKKFELLSACGLDQTTAAPGPNSFTRALIDNLKDLLAEYGDKPFNTFHINQRVCMDQRRRECPSHLWYRLHSDSNILLAPLKGAAKQFQQKTNVARNPRGYLTLRFALRDESLNKEQIEVLTRSLAKAFENKKMIGLKKIDWINIKSAKVSYFERVGLAMYAVAQWKKFLAKKREEKGWQKAAEAMDVDMDQRSPLPSSTRKRSCDVLDHLPGAKRRATDTSQPPLSPVSNSSRSHEEL